MTRPIILAAFALLAAPVSAKTWIPDPDHTEVRVSWEHAGLSRQSLEFGTVEGALEFTPGDVGGAVADFSIPVASVFSGSAQFDEDLKGPGLFDAAAFPSIRFVSTEVVQTGENRLSVTGDLTIRDATLPATFHLTVNKLGEHPAGAFFDAYKGQWLGLTAVATITRSDWGMGAFVPIGSDEIRIEINTEMKAQ